MKVTSEKLPKSLLALDIELDRDQVEKGLDRAARRLSQKVNIPGFRKGKAPRFIVENYYGRSALIEEAYEDLVNKAFKAALDQEQIAPPFARLRSGYSVYSTTRDDLEHGLHEFLELCETLGAEPWYVVPITFSPTEMSNLME